MADISKITLPNGDEYDIKDAVARRTGSSSVTGIVSLSDATNGTQTAASGGTAATPAAVKAAYDLASQKLDASQKGVASGVAELDSNGKVPISQLPSYVDDVQEYAGVASFPATGETGKIYVDTSSNLTYRWSGTQYVEISPSLALGTTSSTAYRGDYGNAAYQHAVTNKGSEFASGLYKITTNAEGHVTAATAVTKSDITGLGIPGSDTDTTYSAGTGLSLDGTTINHSNSVTAATAGTSSATSGSTLAVPYVTYDAQGHVTASGTHTHTVSGFLSSHQTVKQDGITGATVNRFGTCSIAAGTAAKTVSVTTGTFSLEAGARVSVKFSNANTANSPTLNVGGTGAKNIFHKGSQITTGSNKALLAGVCDFIYDGTQWHLVGNYIDTDTNTTYTANTSKLVTAPVQTVVSVGSAPTLGDEIAADDITGWDAGSTPTLGTAIAADDITAWSAGTVPTLGDEIAADDITAWSAGTAASATASAGVVTFTNGAVPSLSYTARSIPNVTSVGTAPSLSYTARSIPNVTSVGSVPTLEYTERSIPNVTSVGSAPITSTVTVATGSLSSTGTGGTVATGITAN